MVNPNRFYTYAYLRKDRTPYYVGKGTRNRLYKRNECEFKPPKDKSRIIFLKQNLTEGEAFKHEIYMIAVFGRKDLGTGILHNKTDGGEGISGLVHSEETKRKIREANTGKTTSDETRRKISETSKGRTHSEETKRKMSEVMKGKNNPNYGKKWWNDCCGNNKLSIKSPGKEWVLGKSVEMKGKSGKKWWNDGCGNVKISAECPGEDWIVGRGEEHIVKSSLSNKGKKWWNDCNGNLKRSIECPGENWYAGRGETHKVKSSLSNKGKKWWNDGCGNSVRAVEFPGLNWMSGRGKPYNTSRKSKDILNETSYL